MIQLVFSTPYLQTTRVILLNQPSIKVSISKALTRIKYNPFDPMLRTKKVLTTKYGTKWSSLVKNDIRIIWDFYGSSGTKIWVFTIGSNKEPLRVYRN